MELRLILNLIQLFQMTGPASRRRDHSAALCDLAVTMNTLDIFITGEKLLVAEGLLYEC